MRKARWLASWRVAGGKPVFYHVISRVVDRRLVFGPREKEKFRALMRMQEKFTGCRVLSYCLMGNHFHLLLEVPPTDAAGISDRELLERLSAIYSEAVVAGVAKEMSDAREAAYAEESHRTAALAAIRGRFTYRMHDLGQFMKGLLQRFTQWFNGVHSRTGRLWEDRFKSVIVEDGVAARTVAAYIDLNPVRAGLVKDPADYRWSGYGEATGGGAKGNGKKARAGLVRALRAHLGAGADAETWTTGGLSREYRKLLMAGAVEKSVETVAPGGQPEVKILRKGMTRGQAARERELDGEISPATALRRRIRYFTDGAVIGSRLFVDEAFSNSRARFGPKRASGARKMKGNAAPLGGILWSLRDLKKGIA